MDAVLELEIGPGPEPGSFLVRVLRSAGGGEPTSTIRLDVECIEARLADLGSAWEALSLPSHRT